MACRLDNLRQVRTAAGLSVSNLAVRSNTSDLVIQRLEDRGDCEPFEAQRIADALGVSLEELGLARLG
jgi:hypothetical protein